MDYTVELKNAILSNDSEYVLELIPKANINATFDEKNLLFFAIQMNSKKNLYALIEAGVDVNCFIYKPGSFIIINSPLFSACCQNNLKLVEILISFNAIIYKNILFDYLNQCCDAYNIKIVNLLIKNGKDSLITINEKYLNYELLKQVLLLNDVKLLNLILKNIALDYETMKILSEDILVSNYDFKYLKLLLKYSKDDFKIFFELNLEKNINFDNYFNILKYLVKINKKININHIFLKQPYSDKYISIFEFLINCGVDINYNKEYLIPIEKALHSKSYNIFNLLLVNGVQIHNCSPYYCNLHKNYELIKFFICYKSLVIKPPPVYDEENWIYVRPKTFSITSICESKYFPIFKLFFDNFDPNDYYDDILQANMSDIQKQYLLEKGFKYKYCELCNELIYRTNINYNFVKCCTCLVCYACNRKIKRNIKGLINIKKFKCLVCCKPSSKQINKSLIFISCYECQKITYIHECNTNNFHTRKLNNTLICDDCAEYKMTCPKCKVKCLRLRNDSGFVCCWNCEIILCYFCERVTNKCYTHFVNEPHGYFLDISELKEFRLTKMLIEDSKNIEYNKFENESDNSDYLSDISYFSDEYDDFCL